MIILIKIFLSIFFSLTPKVCIEKGLYFATSSTELQDDRLPIVLKMHLEFKFPPVDPVPLGDEYQDLNYTGRTRKENLMK